VRVFGIDPGSERTGYGCVETDGRRHHLVTCGVVLAAPADTLPQRLARIHRELAARLSACRPDCVVVESLFHAQNARSAIRLGHARGVAMLAAVDAGCPVVEYTPAEVKRAVVGYGRAEKHQVQQMIKLLLGLPRVPAPHDAADALAVAICHVHSMPVGRTTARLKPGTTPDGRAAQSKPDPAPAGRVVPPRSVEAGLPPSLKLRRTAGAVAEAGQRRLNDERRLPRTWRQYRPPAR
jgi:crossover junction endodeoxyribonuclease RuvC